MSPPTSDVADQQLSVPEYPLSLTPSSPPTYLIDNDHLFGGPAWRFAETGGTGKFMSYPMSAGMRDDLDVWVRKVKCLARTDAIAEIIRSTPAEWIGGIEPGALGHVAEQLKIKSETMQPRVHDADLCSSLRNTRTFMKGEQ